MYIALFLTQIFYFASGLSISDNLNLPCKSTDIVCIEKIVNTLRAIIIAGIPEVQIKTSDPLYFDEIDGDLPNLKYKFLNTTLSGYKTCVLSNLKLLRNITSLQYDLECPQLILSGKYEIKGELVTIPVEGQGDFELITGQYFIHIDLKWDKYQGKDRRDHFAWRKTNLICKPQGPLKFGFKNLFNGQKDLSDAVLKFAHDNWREVALFLQDPVWSACVERYIANLNKLLEIVPIDNFLVH